MPLTMGLLDVILSHSCPHCGHKHEKKGSWFQTIGRYTCLTCHRSVRITYDDKVRLFEMNAHRAIF
jgi:transposase-like protein